MYFTVILIIIPTILFGLYYGIAEYFLNKLHMLNIINGIPGPKAFPIIGNAHLFTGDTTALWNQILNLASVWDSHRKVLNKMFLMKDIKSHMDVFVHHSIALTEKLETLVGGEIDIFGYVFRCTLDIIYDAMLDTHLNSLTNTDCKLAESIQCMMDTSIERILKLWLHPNIIFYNTAIGKKFQACVAYLDNVTNKIIKEKMESILRNKINRHLKAEKLGQKEKTLFEYLFELSNEGEVYTEKDIREEMNTIIIAGSETSATTISFVLLMLATFPEIQGKVYEEVNRFCCSDDPKCVPMTYNDIKSMKLLERVIKETLRLFPAGPVIARKVTQDIKVTKNWTIPKGCSAVFFIYKLHRSAKYWPRPLVFDPDRFLPEKNCSTCFFPFSYGRRNCIGQHFAMLEMATVIATLIKRFRVTIDKPIEIAKIDVKLSITLKPTKPIRLKFEKRN